MNPVGGFKVVYRHAEELAWRGYQVAVLHVAEADRLCWRHPIRPVARFLYRSVSRRAGPGGWYPLHANVTCHWRLCPHPRFLPACDIIIASAWQTAEWFHPLTMHQPCFYLVQDYEHYIFAAEKTRVRIAATYKKGWHFLSISPAVTSMLEDLGVENIHDVPNGIDYQRYHVEQSAALNGGNRRGIGFAWRPESHKASMDTVAALDRIRAHLRPQPHIWAFGASRRPALPAWVDYHQNPDDASLGQCYRKSALFVVSSHAEGWGLPGAEAMGCGAALVSSDNGGVRAYARHGWNALLSPPGDVAQLARNVSTLWHDSAQRRLFAKRGCLEVRQLTWSRAAEGMERALQSGTKA